MGAPTKLTGKHKIMAYTKSSVESTDIGGGNHHPYVQRFRWVVDGGNIVLVGLGSSVETYSC